MIVGSILLLAASLAWQRPIPGAGLFIVIAFPIIFFGHGLTIVGALQRRQARDAAAGVRTSWLRYQHTRARLDDLFGGLVLVDWLFVGGLVLIGVVGLFAMEGVASPERPAGAPACEDVYGDTDEPGCQWAADRDHVSSDRAFASMFLVFSAIAVGSAQATIRRTEGGLGDDRST